MARDIFRSPKADEVIVAEWFRGNQDVALWTSMSCSGGGQAAVCCDYDTETSLSASTVTVLMNYLAIGHSVGPVGRLICITISLQLASDDVGTAAITMQITSR